MSDELKNFQVCSDLDIRDYYSESNNHLSDLIELQNKTQEMYFEKQNKPNFKDMTLKELVVFWMFNKHALEDELSEAITALTGVNEHPNAWKPWKEDHRKLDNMTISDLSKDDLKELKMEIVDAFHFLFNKWISIGGTAQELYNYYISKNERNWERQKNGY